MLLFPKPTLGVLIILLILSVVSSAPVKTKRNNAKGWLNPGNLQKKTKEQPVTVSVSPEDIGRYINQIRSAPYSMVEVLEEKIRKREFRNITEWNEAIDFLKNLEKVPTCNYSVVLERSAMDHA